MKVRVDQSLCTGHARCNAIDPDLFLLDDVGYSSIDTVEVPRGSRTTHARPRPTARARHLHRSGLVGRRGQVAERAPSMMRASAPGALTIAMCPAARSTTSGSPRAAAARSWAPSGSVASRVSRT